MRRAADREVDVAPALLEPADEDEEQGRDHAVRDVGGEAACSPVSEPLASARTTKSAARPTRTGDEALEVALDEGGPDRPDDAGFTGHGEHRCQPAEPVATVATGRRTRP